jgi:undecaprenyl-diphosphatase
MGMSVGGGGAVKAEPNVTPMIDVMLVLLIIFMVSAPLITTGVVDLPSVGRAQARDLIPGVSRSCGTITAWLILGYPREAAARYSFLLAVPAVLASGFYQLWRSWDVGSPIAPGPTALATVVAFVVGYGVIVVFLKFVSTRSYLPFVAYRIALGVGVLALLHFGVLSPL